MPEKRPLLHTFSEEFELKRASNLRAFGNTPPATPWNDTVSKSRSNRASRTKTQRRERRLSLLFSIFQNDVTRKFNSIPTPSVSSLPSQLTLTSIETDPSYFFHGPGSRPSTPVCGQGTDSSAGSSFSTGLGSSLSSFRKESSLSTMSGPNEEEEIEMWEEEEIQEPLDQDNYSATKRRKDFGPMTRHPLIMQPTTSNALGPSDRHDPNNGSVSPIEAEGMISTVTRKSKVQSWVGEWNIEMANVMRGLRELRWVDLPYSATGMSFEFCTSRSSSSTYWTELHICINKLQLLTC
jgi:hypothetical protein